MLERECMEIYKIKKNGMIYERALGGDGEEDHFTSNPASSDIEEIGAHPDVLCGKCHRSKFELRYGSFKILARCIKCGYEAVVYDG